MSLLPPPLALAAMAQDPRSGIRKVQRTVVLFIGTDDTTSVHSAIVSRLNSLKGKFYPDVGGLMVGFCGVKVDRTTSQPGHMVRLLATFFIFRPVAGSELHCVVRDSEGDQVTCLAHNVFEVIVSSSPLETVWAGQEVVVRVDGVEHSDPDHHPIIHGQLVQMEEEDEPLIQDVDGLEGVSGMMEGMSSADSGLFEQDSSASLQQRRMVGEISSTQTERGTGWKRKRAAVLENKAKKAKPAESKGKADSSSESSSEYDSESESEKEDLNVKKQSGNSKKLETSSEESTSDSNSEVKESEMPHKVSPSKYVAPFKPSVHTSPTKVGDIPSELTDKKSSKLSNKTVKKSLTKESDKQKPESPNEESSSINATQSVIESPTRAGGGIPHSASAVAYMTKKKPKLSKKTDKKSTTKVESQENGNEDKSLKDPPQQSTIDAVVANMDKRMNTPPSNSIKETGVKNKNKKAKDSSKKTVNETGDVECSKSSDNDLTVPICPSEAVQDMAVTNSLDESTVNLMAFQPLVSSRSPNKKSVTPDEKDTSDKVSLSPKTKGKKGGSSFQLPPGFTLKLRSDGKVSSYITPLGGRLSSQAKVVAWVAAYPNYLVKQEVDPDAMEVAETGGHTSQQTEYESQSLLATDNSEAKAVGKKDGEEKSKPNVSYNSEEQKSPSKSKNMKKLSNDSKKLADKVKAPPPISAGDMSPVKSPKKLPLQVPLASKESDADSGCHAARESNSEIEESHDEGKVVHPLSGFGGRPSNTEDDSDSDSSDATTDSPVKISPKANLEKAKPKSDSEESSSEEEDNEKDVPIRNNSVKQKPEESKPPEESKAKSDSEESDSEEDTKKENDKKEEAESSSEESSSESEDDQTKPLIKTVIESGNKSAEDSSSESEDDHTISQSKLDKSTFKSPSPKQATKTPVKKNSIPLNSVKGAATNFAVAEAKKKQNAIVEAKAKTEEDSASQSSQVNLSQNTPSQLSSTIMVDKKKEKMSVPYGISPILKSRQEPKTSSGQLDHLFDTVVRKNSGDRSKKVKKKISGKHVAGF